LTISGFNSYISPIPAMCWGVVPGAGGVRRGADRRCGDTPALQRSAAGFRAPFRAGGGLPPRVGGRDGGGLWRGLRAGRRSGLRSPSPRPSRGHPPGERLAVLAEYREQRGRPSRKCVRTPLFRGGRQDAVRVRDHAAPVATFVCTGQTGTAASRTAAPAPDDGGGIKGACFFARARRRSENRCAVEVSA
jgi:hypothetical protein